MSFCAETIPSYGYRIICFFFFKVNGRVRLFAAVRYGDGVGAVKSGEGRKAVFARFGLFFGVPFGVNGTVKHIIGGLCRQIVAQKTGAAGIFVPVRIRRMAESKAVRQIPPNDRTDGRVREPQPIEVFHHACLQFGPSADPSWDGTVTSETCIAVPSVA